MENKIMTLPGSLNVEFDNFKQTVSISEYGQHIISMSYTELDALYVKLAQKRGFLSKDDCNLFNKPVLYTSVVLSTESKWKLWDYIESVCFNPPKDWVRSADHVTLCMSPMPPDAHYAKGEVIEVEVDAIGFGTDIVAVRCVKPTRLDDRQAHITIAYNPAYGVRPKDANNITNWLPLRESITLYGAVSEITKS